MMLVGIGGMLMFERLSLGEVEGKMMGKIFGKIWLCREGLGWLLMGLSGEKVKKMVSLLGVGGGGLGVGGRKDCVFWRGRGGLDGGRGRKGWEGIGSGVGWGVD